MKATGQDFARQLINPVTEEDFKAAYGDGTSKEQQFLGRAFAREVAEFSAMQLDGSILNMRNTTSKMVHVLESLNDQDFALGFNEYLFRVNNYFKNNNELMNALSSAVVHVDRPCVTELLKSRGYQYNPKPKM